MASEIKPIESTEYIGGSSWKLNLTLVAMSMRWRTWRESEGKGVPLMGGDEIRVLGIELENSMVCEGERPSWDVCLEGLEGDLEG